MRSGRVVSGYKKLHTLRWKLFPKENIARFEIKCLTPLKSLFILYFVSRFIFFTCHHQNQKAGSCSSAANLNLSLGRNMDASQVSNTHKFYPVCKQPTFSHSQKPMHCNVARWPVECVTTPTFSTCWSKCRILSLWWNIEIKQSRPVIHGVCCSSFFIACIWLFNFWLFPIKRWSGAVNGRA